MNFSNRLDLLIRNFGSSNSKLAKAINVDPSLVSKWRNGNRILNPSSSYTHMMADYFLYIASLQNKYNTLIELLIPHYPKAPSFTQDQLEQAFIEWFTSPVGAESNNQSGNIPHTGTLDLNAGIHSLLTKLDSLSSTPRENIPLNHLFSNNTRSLNGEVGTYEMFKGNAGRRKAVMNIIEMMYASSQLLELLFLDEAGLDWLIEDREFYVHFGNSLKTLLEKGHKITIIHHVMRSPAELNPIIDFWLPLYFTGRVKSYYYPKYTENLHKKTLCIIHGVVAAISVGIELEKENDMLMVFTDPGIVRISEEIYSAFLAKCKPLIEIYSSMDPDKLQAELCKLEAKIGKRCTLNNKPSVLTMPLCLYSRLLDRLSLSAEEKNKKLELYQQRFANFEKIIPYNEVIEIINTEIFDRLVPKDLLYYESLEVFSDTGIECTPADMIEHLENMIYLLGKYENYKVILTNLNHGSPQYKTSLSYKAESHAMAISGSPYGGNATAMILREDYIVNGIGQYLAGLIEYVPESKRNKECVTRCLESYIFMLREWEKNQKA